MHVFSLLYVRFLGVAAQHLLKVSHYVRDKWVRANLYMLINLKLTDYKKDLLLGEQF